MPRIAFDPDGVLADMESDLIRQADVLFGEAMTHRLQERAGAHLDNPDPTGLTTPVDTAADTQADLQATVEESSDTLERT